MAYSKTRRQSSKGHSATYLLYLLYTAVFRSKQLPLKFTTADVVNLVRTLRLRKPNGAAYKDNTLGCVLSNADIANWMNKNSQKVLESCWLSGNRKIYWFIAAPN